ncbi:unnamed protein product [Orchesella dallaii]
MFKVTPLTPNTSPSASPTLSPSPKPSPSPQKEDSPVPAPVLPSIESASQAEKPTTTTPLQSPKLIKFQLGTKTSAKTTEMKNSVEVQGSATAAAADQPKQEKEDEKKSDDKGEPVAGPSVTNNGAIQPPIEHAEELQPETEESNEDRKQSVDKGEPIAGSSRINKGATQPTIGSGEGHQLETEESKKVAEIKKFVEQQRTTSSADSSCAYKSNQSCSLTAEDMTQILARMGCLDCHKIPSPFRLFQCPRGHLFCFDCGMKRFTEEDEGHISSGTCDHEIEKEEKGSKSKSSRGIGYGLINPDLKLAAGEIEKPVKNKKTGKYECRLRVRQSMGDPVYKAMYNNTLWNCPYMRYGCQEKVYGRDIHEHMLPCMKKLGIL